MRCFYPESPQSGGKLYRSDRFYRYFRGKTLRYEFDLGSFFEPPREAASPPLAEGSEGLIRREVRPDGAPFAGIDSAGLGFGQTAGDLSRQRRFHLREPLVNLLGVFVQRIPAVQSQPGHARQSEVEPRDTGPEFGDARQVVGP